MTLFGSLIWGIHILLTFNIDKLSITNNRWLSVSNYSIWILGSIRRSTRTWIALRPHSPMWLTSHHIYHRLGSWILIRFPTLKINRFFLVIDTKAFLMIIVILRQFFNWVVLRIFTACKDFRLHRYSWLLKQVLSWWCSWRFQVIR